MAEAGIEKAGVMHAELADQRVEGHHLRGMIGRHLYRLAGHKDIELVRIENEFGRAAPVERLPEIENIERIALVNVDDGGVALGSEADQPVAAFAQKVDRQRHAFADFGIGIKDQRVAGMKIPVLRNR